MPRYSPHQGEFRIGQQRYNFKKKGGLFGDTYTAAGVSASSERALKRKLEERNAKRKPRPTGSGKTQTQASLTDFLFGTKASTKKASNPWWSGW